MNLTALSGTELIARLLLENEAAHATAMSRCAREKADAAQCVLQRAMVVRATAASAANHSRIQLYAYVIDD